VADHAPHRRIRLSLLEPVEGAALARYGDVVAQDGASVTLEVPRERSVDVATRVLADLDVEDLAIEDPPIEDVVRAVFDHG
jgi:ABC-2 type transport system ATP-binding protein